MSIVTINPNPSEIDSGFTNAKTYDTIIVKNGTGILDKAPPRITGHFVSVIFEGSTFRMVLTPHVSDADEKNIAAMNLLGLSGKFSALDKTQKAAVQQYVKDHPTLDFSGVETAVNVFLRKLPPVRESRLRDANPQRLGDITYNGKSYQFDIEWGSQSNAAGVVGGKSHIWGLYARGGRIENSRNEGGNYNAAGGGAQHTDSFFEGMTFVDCENGISASEICGIARAGGEWCDDSPPTKYDMFGFNIDKNCIYDGCGAIGKAHSKYTTALVSLSYGAKIIRANSGNGIKSKIGLQMIINGDFEDPADPKDGGYVDPGDLDAGPCYVINTKAVKASAATGNYGAVILFRNGRAPIPIWLPCVAGMTGCDLTFDLSHSGAVVEVQNEAAFAHGWPGVPTPFQGFIKENILRWRAGANVQAIKAPAGVVIGNNHNLAIGAAAPDVRISLPNYELTRKTYKQYVSDLLSVVDPASSAWLPKLLSLPPYPAGTPAPVFQEAA